MQIKNDIKPCVISAESCPSFFSTIFTAGRWVAMISEYRRACPVGQGGDPIFNFGTGGGQMGKRLSIGPRLLYQFLLWPTVFPTW
jgi:hypothetical protein